jgi:glutamine amidotransferase
MIAIVDYGAGNVASVQKAFAHLGFEAVVSARRDVLHSASHVVFPGQGHFGQAMQRLRDSGLDIELRDIVDRGTPFLGICLGLQLLFDGSEEAPGVAGLGLLPGRCVRFDAALRTPQIGWNRVMVQRGGSALDAVPLASYWYFVHSYHAVASRSEDVVATADYGGPFTAAVARDNLLAVQCHPEKSGEVGLQFLQAWLTRTI